MEQHTTPVTRTRATWFEIAADTWSDLSREGQRPTGEQFASALASRLEADGKVVAGWLQGVEVLATYAAADQRAEESAREEERQSVKAAFKAVRPILEARLQQRLTRVDAEATVVTCRGCGHSAQLQGLRTRGWQSTVGPLELTRRYHWCESCGQGRARAQEKVGLPPDEYTVNLAEICALMATTVPHEMAVGLVSQVLGIEVSPKGIKQIVKRRGDGVVAQQDTEARDLTPYEENGLPREVARPADAVAKVPQVAYLEMDGVIVMTREVLAGTAAEATAAGGRGGKGRTYHVAGREVKNAVLYEGAQCAQESDSRACILEKSYVSHLGDGQHFALLVWAQMRRLRYDQAPLVVVLSDGAEWIRHLCEWLPIPVLMILDLFHVKHRIWEVAHALYGEKTSRAHEWANTQCQQVEEGHTQRVIDMLRGLSRPSTTGRERVNSLITYLVNNLDRMDYPHYRAQGLRVGSGAVESTNYHVTGARLKLQGMRWSEPGAAEMARLRTDLFNGLWEARTRQLLKAA